MQGADEMPVRSLSSLPWAPPGPHDGIVAAMRIVITTTLNNNLFHAKMTPLLRARPDLEVVVVTDREGPPIPGVRWVWPRGLLSRCGELFPRLLQLLLAILHPRTRLVMAYGLVPHGLFAVTLSRLRAVPVYLHFIGGPAEIQFAHDIRVVENRVLRRARNPHLWQVLVRRAAHRAKRIFVPGSVTRAFLLREGYAPDTVSMLHSATDPALYFPGTAARDLDVIVSARLCERKRPLFTLQVLAEVRSRYPAARFCWLGDGVMHDEFASALRELDLQDVTEWLSTDSVGPYYRRAKVFLLCSMNEGLSLACLEAMACGAVPVVSDCGDMADAVIPGSTGLLLDTDAGLKAYAEAVLAILNSDALRSSCSSAAAQLIAAEHSFPVTERRWREILAEL